MESPTVPVGGKKEVSAADVAQVLGKTGSLIGRTVTRIRIFFQSGEWVSRETLGQKGNWDLPHLASICDAYDKAIGGKKMRRGLHRWRSCVPKRNPNMKQR